MARFCANCGQPLGEGDRVCGNCGQPVQNVSAAGSVAEGMAAPAKAANNRKWIKFVIIAAVAIVIVIVAAKLAGNFIGYKGTIRRMVKAMQDYDIEKLESMASTISDETQGNNEYYNYEDTISAVLDGYEAKVGEISKIKYEITDTAELSENAERLVKKNLVDVYNIDVENIKSIMHIEMMLTVKGSEKSASYNVDDLYLIKEGRKWKLYYGELDY